MDEAVAANSAGVAEHKTLYDAAGIDRRTADTYDELLGRLFIAEQIPAWNSRHLDRLDLDERILALPVATFWT